MNLKLLTYLTFTLALSCYAFAVGQWKIFPYDLLKEIEHSIKYNYENRNYELSQTEKVEGEKYDFGELVDLIGVELTETELLNSFTLNWGRLSVGSLGKTGAAELRGNKLWYVNQDAPQLIETLSLTNKIAGMGGIKAIFSLGNENYAYVVYIDGNCASARLVSLSSMNVTLQLPCMPASKANMDMFGGGWLKISESEILLSTGTPTSEHVDNKINKAAQLDSSLWGKILKLTAKKNTFVVEIFSKGHRNVQGITRIDGDIIAVEHGPKGGDEVNIVTKGGNYGWPLQSLGSEYSLNEINKSYIQPITTNLPLLAFTPSIGISYANVCPLNYIEYYAPQKCVAVSSMHDNAIYFIIYSGEKVLFTERIEFNSRIRKFFVQNNNIVAVTDFEGVIVGKLMRLDR